MPEPGQGKPLPEDFSHKGEWVSENLVFLYQPDATQALGGAGPRFTVVATAPDGGRCFGFDCSQIAAILDFTIDGVFEANRSGDLILADVTSGVVGPSGAAAKRFVFKLAGRTCAFFVESAGVTGHT